MPSIEKIVIILSIFMLTAVCVSRKKKLNEEWKSYKKKYLKRYTNSTEEMIRKSIFEKNSKFIKKHNKEYKNGKHTYKMGYNIFTDMTDKELKYFVMDPLFENRKEYKIHEEYVNDSMLHNLPNSFNWVKKGWDTDVPIQGKCGSCYIFGVTGSIEAHYFIKYGEHIKLSAQDVVDCARRPDYALFGCRGGSQLEVFRYAKEKGISLLSEYPYNATDGKCSKTGKQIKIQKYSSVQKNENALKWVVVNRGPPSVRMHGPLSFLYHKKGIFYDEECSSINKQNHVVVVVGYGSENGDDYWLLKNSWGKYWGEKGYFKMARNKDNHCGITNSIVYPSF